MLLAAVAAFAGAFVQSATGMGFALVLSPALFAVMDPEEAVTAVLHPRRRAVPARARSRAGTWSRTGSAA